MDDPAAPLSTAPPTRRAATARVSTNTATVGVVGVGLLGSAVASRLLAAGYAVIGYDVASACLARLTQMGGTAEASAADVARRADIVCTVLPSLPTVEHAILGPEGVAAGARPGLTICQMSTISPTLTCRLAQESAVRGLTFLDTPISGTSTMVAMGNGIIFVGGDKPLYERWRPLLEAVLPRAVHVGAAGQAMMLKLIANLLVALHSAAAAEALTMARRTGLDPQIALDALADSAATSRMLEVRGPLIIKGEFPAQMKLELFMKDLHLIQEAAREAGAPLPLTDVAEKLYAAAQAAGHGAEDLSVIATSFAPRSAAPPRSGHLSGG